MNSFLTKSGKIGVILSCVLLLAVSAIAQSSLRKALDFDGDGKADYSIFRATDNSWYIRGSGGGLISQAFGSSNTDYQAPGDFDGDGKADISVFRDTDGGWYRLNSSNNTFSGVFFGTSGDEPVARDYDGDGKTDQAVIRRSGGVLNWYILKSTTGTLQGVQFGADATDYSAPGDYDGDGKIDIAVQRTGANPTDAAIFYILQSSNNAVTGIAWGISSDMVVPGDYDGDGKTDIAVIREGANANSPLNWYIRQSSNGAFRGEAFGATGPDLNAQADYDGDGKTDIAVWRDTNGTYYIKRSTDGAIVSFAWGTANDFPIASYDIH